MFRKFNKSKLIIIVLTIWIVLSNGFVFYAWKVSNFFDLVLYQRILPLECMVKQWEYERPYPKEGMNSVTESEWEIYQKVGKERIKDISDCPSYKGYVWFDVVTNYVNELRDRDIENR